MLFIVIAMLVIVVVAALVVAFVAYPHRGERIPGAAWLGHTMDRAVGSLPTISDGEIDHDERRRARL